MKHLSPCREMVIPAFASSSLVDAELVISCLIIAATFTADRNSVIKNQILCKVRVLAQTSQPSRAEFHLSTSSQRAHTVMIPEDVQGTRRARHGTVDENGGFPSRCPDPAKHFIIEPRMTEIQDHQSHRTLKLWNYGIQKRFELKWHRELHFIS